MTIKKGLLIIMGSACLLTFCKRESSVDQGFCAYYTNVGATSDITGKYADIVVKAGGDREIVFCKESGYQPFLRIGENKWPVREVIGIQAAVSKYGLDEFNKYAYARIIVNTPEMIMIHWRYIPDLHDIGFRSVVNEYFTIGRDRKIQRIISTGDPDLNIYNDPKSRIVQELKITSEGFSELSFKAADISFESFKPIAGSTVADNPGALPVAWWKFDEGLKENDGHTYESMDGIKCTVGGNTSLWKQGISGTALAFDGYDSKVVLERGRKKLFKNDFAIESWVVLGAYPWEWGPIIDYTTDGRSGLYFGVNSDGMAGIILNAGTEKAELISQKQIPLYRWTHVAVSFDRDRKLIGIFIDGEKSGEIGTGEMKLKITETGLTIGLNKWPRKTANHVSRDYPPEVRTPLGNQASIYGIEGIIDEVKIYDQALSDWQFAGIRAMAEERKDIINRPDLEKRVLPGQVDGKNAEMFGARYTSLKFHELWDNRWRSGDYADVVVKFDELPVSIVYWRGTNFGPAYVTENNIWMSDQSSETETEYGCAEHMADKQCRYSHVGIIENTPARVLVHWRYASADATYQLASEKSWTDEYHYIYPDGTLIRYVYWYTGEEGFEDLQFLTAPGEKQEDVIHLQAMSIANDKGDVQDMDWSTGIPRTEIDHATIASINFKSDYKVFAVFPTETRGITAWGERERATPETRFAGPWNHWPVGQVPNDGNYALHTDRVSSSALGGSDPKHMAMYGFTHDSVQTLVPVDKSWNHAPEVSNLTGAKSNGYQREEKAYSFSAESNELSFTIDASDDHPLHNPCFEINNWNSKKAAILEIDGKVLPDGKSCRQGIILDENGKEKLLIWIKVNANARKTFKISV